MIRVGVDLGGTKIEGIALLPNGREIGRKRIATPRGDYDGTIRAIADLVGGLEDDEKATIGIAMPGAISPATGLVKNANSTWLNGMPFDRDLAVALGRPVRVANDANCLAVSEAMDGAGAGKPIVFAVILGTGVGGGIALSGVPLAGRNAIAGEWGHNPLPWPQADELPGPACYCGKHGCIETFLSGPGMAADYRRITGIELDAASIAMAAAGGDVQALATLARHRERLGRALATVVNILDPDIVVIGGGLSKLTGLYAELPVLMDAWCFSDAVVTPVVPALHGDASGVRGAAWLWPSSEEASS